VTRAKNNTKHADDGKNKKNLPSNEQIDQCNAGHVVEARNNKVRKRHLAWPRRPPVHGLEHFELMNLVPCDWKRKIRRVKGRLKGARYIYICVHVKEH
jgi:hypothetical protein